MPVAVQIGPRGGKYWIDKSGEKVYGEPPPEVKVEGMREAAALHEASQGAAAVKAVEAKAQHAPHKWAPVQTTPVPKVEVGGELRPVGRPGAQLPPDMFARLAQLGVKKLPAAHIAKVEVSDRLYAENQVHAGALLRWRDDSNHPQGAYSPEFDRPNAERKWQRVLAQRPKVEAAIKDIEAHAHESTPHAAALVIIHTGLRPGSPESEKKYGHYGVTTMQAQHVSFDEAGAHIRYVGKEGVANVAHVSDPKAVEVLRRHVEGKAPGDRVFGVSSEKVQGVLPKGTLVKDLRTIHAARIAERALSEAPPPPPPLTGDRKKDARTVAKLLGRMSETVARDLNNTPAMARRSYIPPQIIRAWARERSVPEEIIKWKQ